MGVFKQNQQALEYYLAVVAQPLAWQASCGSALDHHITAY